MSDLTKLLPIDEDIEYEFEQRWILWVQVYAVIVFSFMVAFD